MSHTHTRVAATPAPSTSTAHRPRRPLKASAAAPASSIPATKSAKSSTLAQTVAPRTSSTDHNHHHHHHTNSTSSTSQSAPAVDRRRRGSTTQPANTTTTASTSGLSGKGQRLRSTTSHDGRAAERLSKPASTSASVTPPPLLSRQRSGPTAISHNSAAVPASQPEKRSRSVSVSKKRQPTEAADARTQIAGVKLPPLSRGKSERRLSSEPLTALKQVAADCPSPTRTLSTFPEPVQSGSHTSSPPLPQYGSTHRTSNGPSSYHLSPHVALKSSPSLAPLSPVSHSASALFTTTPSTQAHALRTPSRTASSGSVGYATSAQHSPAVSHVLFPHPFSSHLATERIPSPPTLRQPSYDALYGRRRSRTSDAAVAAARGPQVTRERSDDFSDVESLAMTKQGTEKAIPELVDEASGVAATARSSASEDASKVGLVKAEEEEEEEEEEDDEEETEEESDGEDAADDTEATDDEDEDDSEYESEEDSDDEDEDEDEDDDEEEDEEDEEEEEEVKPKKRRGVSGRAAPSKTRVAAAAKARGKAKGNSTAPASQGNASNGYSKDQSEGPRRIRTKISREGDVNVKVVYAVRTRHCFNRFVKEIMTRFGFAKATDFDMYCIDTTGDRVDIDVEEDFDQLLDAFEAGVGEDAGVAASLTDSFFSTTAGSTNELRGGPVRGASPDAQRKTPYLPPAPGSQRGGRLPVLHSKSSSSFASGAQGNGKEATLQSTRSRSLTTPSGLGATSGGGMEDDGKSSTSVVRLYVRYSNAYYKEQRLPEHLGSPIPASSLYASPNPPGHLTDPNVASFFTNQLQQLSSLRPISEEGVRVADQAARLGGNGGGTPFSHTLLASTLDSGGGSHGALHRPGSRVAGGFSGVVSLAGVRSSHGAGITLEPLSPENASLGFFNESQRSTLAGTFVVDEGELVEWRRMSVLGKGSFGTVYEGITLDGKMIAVKVQELPQDDDAAEIKALQTEINLMRSLKHRNIVAYYGCQTRAMPTGNQQMEIFLELCHGGSLATLRRKLIKTQHTFGISLVRSYTRQVLEGLAYLHAQHVIHRDIKSDNVLISATGEAKLADFGCSKRFGGGTVQATASTLAASPTPAAATAAAAPAAMYQTMVGSPFFMAPEVMREDEGGYTSAADIWSVGCLVIELLGREPWEVTGTNIFQIMFRIARERGMPTGVPPNCPAMLHAFFEQCFERDPAKRATAAELLEHEWMTCSDKVLEEVPSEAAES